MRTAIRLALTVAGLVLPVTASAAIITGAYYAIQYDYSEFFSATDRKPFRIEIAGNPFPSLTPEETARRLLPVMQATKPPPALTFTYDRPADRPRPDYRLVLVFDAANDLGADTVCSGKIRQKAGTPGQVNLFAVYCRNDLSMSQAVARTGANAPDDPEMRNLFAQLFRVLFDNSMARRPHNGGDSRR